MIILGIDPGTAITGFGVLDFDPKKNTIKYVDCGVILTPKEDEHKDRLKDLHDGIVFLIKKHKPKVVSVEKLFFAKNVTTAMTVSQARGVILLAAAQYKIDVAEFTPMQVKMALTGYGKATKRQIQKMIKFYLGLGEIPKPDDAADALCVALCHVNSYGMKKLLTRAH